MLPEAVDNYLLRLGWGHGDDEIISREQAVAWFDLPQVGKSPSRFDFRKLENLNGHYIREADDERLVGLIAPKLALSAEQRLLLLKAMPDLKSRANTIKQLADNAVFLFAKRPLEMDQAATALLTADARSLLFAAHRNLAALANWDAASLETAIREVAEASDVKLGMLAQPLRAVLTGRTTSPGIFDVLALLGRDESLDRIADQMEPKE
jgi:glutamyl-tRNA synthetase